MYSIKRSMQWDEDVFGLECDLDLYNIVATNDFNMGAMSVVPCSACICYYVLKFHLTEFNRVEFFILISPYFTLLAWQ